ncbi:MAG: RnfABCDGE type electron transport complex subunit B [bacterium]
MSNEILIPVIMLGAFGLLFGFGLAFAARVFAVQVDPRIEKIEELLPGANCGACGLPGCSGYAAAVVRGEAPPNLCAAVSSESRARISEILGVAIEEREIPIAVVRCTGDVSPGHHKFNYLGETVCAEAVFIAEGPNPCRFGCVGMGSCVAACPFDAMIMGEGKPPSPDPDKCVGCGLCVTACPKNLIELAPRDRHVFVLCRSHYKGKQVKEICKTGCTGCGICAKKCPEEAIELVDNLPVINHEKCKNHGVCAEKCPSNAILFTGEIARVTSSE